MKQQLEQIKTAALEAIAAAQNSADCENVRVKYLGKKGELTAILKSMGGLSPEERPIMGQLVNTAKAEVDAALSAKVTEMQAAAEELKLKEETIDITMPAKELKPGKLHPLNTVLDDMINIFQSMGFDVVDGPEVETDHYNFECLNVPADHPARDMQDTFYLAENILLRTQTSAAQIRTMETRKPPIRVICPGRVFRADEVDATHSPVFHQIEGLVVDKGVTMCDLKGVLEEFAHEIYGSDTKVKFRPSFFPFTEPSVEVDVSCFACGGAGCKLCKGTGWIEVLGAGMVNRRVLENCGVNPDEYTGFAFGMGIERIAMLKYGINNIKHLFESDIKVLGQLNDK